MSESIAHDENSLVVIEYNDQRILTSKQLAEAYGTDIQLITNNFSRNKERYTPGKHYYVLEGEQKRAFLDLYQNDVGSKNAKVLYLWTEKGALLHAKSLGTDQAWAVYEQLVDEYFRLAKADGQSPARPLLNSLYYERFRLFSRHTKIPRDRWCVFAEICQPFTEFEVRGYQLPNKAVPDISVGKRWCVYAREVLGYDLSLIEVYPHVYPDERGIQPANIYPLEWLPAFRLWFYTIYLPEHFSHYLKYLKATRSEIDLVLEGFGLPPLLK